MAKMQMDEEYGGMSDAYESDDTEAKSKPETVDEEEQEQMERKAVVPVKVLMGNHTEPIKAGDEVVLKVTDVNGDQATVVYSETKPEDIDEEEGEGDGDEDKEMSPDDELESMDNPRMMGY